MILEVGVEDFQANMERIINQQVREVVADLEVAYHGRGLDTSRVRISVTINYNIRALAPNLIVDDPVARSNNADIERGIAEVALAPNPVVSDRIARSTNADIERGIAEFRRNVINRGRNPYRCNAATLPEDTNDLTFFAAAALSLGFLPAVSLDALPDDAKNCVVCQEPYAGRDRPVTLKCHHIVGRACIEIWILGGHNSCPLCRAAIFEPAERRVEVD